MLNLNIYKARSIQNYFAKGKAQMIETCIFYFFCFDLLHSRSFILIFYYASG